MNTMTINNITFLDQLFERGISDPKAIKFLFQWCLLFILMKIFNKNIYSLKNGFFIKFIKF